MWTVSILLTIVCLNCAFQNVVVNALMVTQSRRDLENGSSDLQVYAWSLVSVGGIMGAIFAAFFTQYLTPSHSFMMCMTFSSLIMAIAFFINPELEKKSYMNTDSAEQ